MDRMIKGIGHIGIAVKNIEESLAAVSNALDVPVPSIKDHPEKKMRVALVDFKGIDLEFVEDYSEDGEFAEFVRRRGGNAIHHFCLLTDDIEGDIRKFEGKGIEMADRHSRIGLRGKKIAFTKSTALGGIPIELSEP